MTNTSTGQKTRFTYDGDGNRVKKVSASGTIAYVGNYYEYNVTTSVATSYYYAGSTRVAMRQGGAVYYLHADYPSTSLRASLGSASLTTDASGNKVSDERYYPYGETRSGSSPTDRQFTGQRRENGLGSLYDFQARHYSPLLGRFLSADTIVPSPGNPQSLNRYSYVLGNPLKYIDPTGHMECLLDDFCLRTTDDGSYRVVRGGSVFASPAERALANYILSGGDSGYLNAIVSTSPGDISLAEANVEAELGYRRSWNTTDPGIVILASTAVDKVMKGKDNEGGLPQSVARSERLAYTQTARDAATAGKLNLPFKDPALSMQIQSVVDSMDSPERRPPAGVRQGGALDINGNWKQGLFQNRQGVLPIQPEGYYTESDVWSGSGPRGGERLVFGDGGDVYYTNNHYRRTTFVRIR